MNIGHLTLWQIELTPWYAFIMVWAVAALWVKTTKVSEPVSSRLAYSSLMAAGFYLLFSQRAPVGILKERFIGTAGWIPIAGIGLTFAGVALSIWARIMLGENWSGRITKKVDHELIRSGPYAHVRHPIYSGLLLACIGTALVVGEWKGVVAIPLVLAAESIKARREEQFMTDEFGETYREYRQRTGFLIPRWR